MSIRIWTINRVLRWTGVRLFVELEDDGEYTRIGFRWWGWRFVTKGEEEQS